MSELRKRSTTDKSNSAASECVSQHRTDHCLLCRVHFTENGTESCKITHETEGWMRGDTVGSDVNGVYKYYYYALCTKCGEECHTEADDAGPTVGVEGYCRIGEHIIDNDTASEILTKMEITRTERIAAYHTRMNRFYTLLAIVFILY